MCPTSSFHYKSNYISSLDFYKRELVESVVTASRLEFRLVSLDLISLRNRAASEPFTFGYSGTF